ncbi:MAG: helicase [Desulfuromonas sp.]|nr:MAG: helicase [Desulfuromonas sp.]
MNDYLSPAAQVDLRCAILEAGGNEVFCLGRTDAAQLVTEVEILARGNRDAVPAILHSCRPGDVVIHNHPGGNLEPSDPDLEIAGRLGEVAVGFYIVDNAVETLYRVVEPFPPPAVAALNPADIVALIGPGGDVSTALSSYEDRPEQLRMACAVAEAFNRHQIALVEAGTGTGKSLAYLVPAILWAVHNRERVVVSTNTINLQEQLVGKDLPFLQRATGLDFRFELVKGRSNYLCRRRLGSATAEPGLFDGDQQLELEQLRGWAEKSADGSREDLPSLPAESLWEEVCCEADQCARAQCRFFASCFLQRARRRAAHSDLLVVNHALLMTDLALRRQTGNLTSGAILPPFSRLVLDEAHHLEDVATRFFSTQVTRFAFARILNRLRHPRKPYRGLLPRLHNLIGNQLDQNQDQLFRAYHERIEALLSAGQRLLERSIDDLEATGLQCASIVGEEPSRGDGLRRRLLPELTEATSWGEVEGRLRALVRAINSYAEQLQDLIKELRRLPEELNDKARSLTTDLRACAMRLQSLADQLLAFVGRHPGDCCWLEAVIGRVGRGEGLITRLCTAPLQVAPVLRESLFERMQTVVLTSATLTVAGSFDYLEERVGLCGVESTRRTRLQLSSPFDYARQALLAVPGDIPEPGRDGFTEAVRDLVEQVLRLTAGGSFVLFTSYSLLRRVHDELAPILRVAGRQVLYQGQASRHRLLNQFSQAPGSVLFATDSFWEGVDVPGRALEQVIIVRLPFKVPTEPILQARAEAIAAAGGDPFRSYTVPQAVIRFRQGFGRLIRQRSDRGVVLILDVRVVKKNYGKIFLRSLPEVPSLVLPQRELLEKIREFWAAPDE